MKYLRKKADKPMGKRAIHKTMLDGKVCKECMAMHDSVFDLAEPLPVGTVFEPHIHKHCRCRRIVILEMF